MELSIVTATADDAPHIARLVKALTDEICERTGTRYFNVDLTASTQLCRRLIKQGSYRVLLVVDPQNSERVGCATLCESHALYAEGSFGIVQEFYIAPAFRSRKIGGKLLEKVVALAQKQAGNASNCAPLRSPRLSAPSPSMPKMALRSPAGAK
jgi:GNAT superfamily N-acetyltransferase